MKPTSKNIESSRFALLFKKELVENRHRLLLSSIMLLSILIVVSLFIGVSNINFYNDTIERSILSATGEVISYYGDNSAMFGSPKDGAALGCAMFFIFALPIALSISASLMFENMSSKQNRISLLMIPCTTFEKYLARFIIYILGTIIIFCVGCLAADYIRYLIFSLSYNDYNIVHPIDFSYLWQWIMTSNNIYNTSIYLSWVMFSTSIYALGSSVWPRMSFVKTFGTVIGIGFIGWFIIIACTINSDKQPLIFKLLDNAVNSQIFFSIIFTIISITNFILAYFRIKESEVIQRM